MDNKILKYFIMLFISALALWPLLDYCITLITGEIFEYSVYSHVLEPIIFSFLMTLIFMFEINDCKCDISKKEKRK